MAKCPFSLSNIRVEIVDSLVHIVGHVISSKWNDDYDIAQRGNHYIGQVSNVDCSARSYTDLFVHYKLFRSEMR